MKVVHIGHIFMPPEHPSFEVVDFHPARWVLNLALAQKAHASIEPELVVQVPGAQVNFEAVVEGIPVHYLAAPKRLRSATFFAFDSARIARCVKSLAPDLVHAHGTEDAYGLAAQRTGLPCVLTAQGLCFLVNREVPPPLLHRSRLVAWTERRCLRNCRDVIAKSAYVADALHQRYPELAVHRIPNTYDSRLESIREPKKEKNLFAFVGRFDPRKGIDLICDALRMVRMKCPEARLDIYGDVPRRASDYEIEMKARLKDALGEAVTFKGTVAAIEVARGISRAQALVAPSLEEMFGNQVIEALLVGTHVVVSDETAMAENVRRFGNGTIVAQRDALALAGELERIINAETMADGQAARARVVEAFGPGPVARAHHDLYEEIQER
ncbi:MAG: glycosyltransferase family 4 protein [Verrucomicrobiales bacterium]